MDMNQLVYGVLLPALRRHAGDMQMAAHLLQVARLRVAARQSQSLRALLSSSLVVCQPSVINGDASFMSERQPIDIRYSIFDRMKRVVERRESTRIDMV